MSYKKPIGLHYKLQLIRFIFFGGWILIGFSWASVPRRESIRESRRSTVFTGGIGFRNAERPCPSPCVPTLRVPVNNCCYTCRNISRSSFYGGFYDSNLGGCPRNSATSQGRSFDLVNKYLCYTHVMSDSLDSRQIRENICINNNLSEVPRDFTEFEDGEDHENGPSSSQPGQ